MSNSSTANCGDLESIDCAVWLPWTELDPLVDDGGSTAITACWIGAAKMGHKDGKNPFKLDPNLEIIGIDKLRDTNVGCR
jgi:hypothetical protein